MAVAPGVFARNRLFTFFQRPEVQEARARASILRGVVRQLPRAADVTVEPGGAGAFQVRYRLPHLSFERSVELSGLELACLRFLAERAGVPGFVASEEDRGALAAALAGLGPTIALK